MSLSQTPTSHSTFIENKGPTSIRQACQKTVEAPFSLFFRGRIRPIASCYLLATLLLKIQALKRISASGRILDLPVVRP
jgi:hypothetical protein